MSFRLKLIIPFLLVVIFSLSFFYFWTNRRLGSFLLDLTTTNLEEHIDTLLPLIDLGNPDIDRFVDRLGASVSLRLSVIDREGKVVADSSFSGSELRDLEDHSSRPEVREAWRTGLGQSLRFSTSTGNYLVYVAKPLPDGSGVLRVAQRPEAMEQISRGLRKALSLAALGLLLLGGLAVWIIARQLTRSLDRLSEAAVRISAGDFISEIPVVSRDEVGDLARHMEELSSRLEKQLFLLEKERNHLDTVLNSMTEGVLVTDARMRISSCNPALIKMFHLKEDPVGRMPLEVIRSPEIKEGLDAVMEERSVQTMEIQNGDRAFLARFSPVGKEDRDTGVVVVFHDITELRRLEALQREFVSNVSHELKTPLTSIRGYAETLLEDDRLDQPFRGFSERIVHNASQLSEMIDELFSLARLERGEKRLSVEKVNFSELMSEIQRDYAHHLEEKEIEFSFQNETGDPAFEASAAYMRRVFKNLVENAIKYTDHGSIRVSLTRAEGGGYQFEVSDTGIGISEEHLDRIFERFYRVHKDRSRQTGGSGIGLAIVKHIVQLHRGRVWAESELGGGTSIFFTVPQED